MDGSMSHKRESSKLPALEDSDFWLDIDNIHIGPEIGKGEFSNVYVGKYFGDLVAVKKQTRTQRVLEEYLLRELSVLKIATHKNLVSYIGAHDQESVEEHGLSALYIITELCAGGDFLRLLLNKHVELEWDLRLKMAFQIASAMDCLHSKKLIHRDIKSSNVMLDDHYNCKLTDFGMARYISDPSTVRKMTICGTHEYMAPEMLFDEEYSQSIDIFSFGMVLFEILKRDQIGNDGYLVRRPQNKFEIDIESVRSMMPPHPESMFTLAEQCTAYDHSLRPGSGEVVDWLSDLFDAKKVIPLPKNYQSYLLTSLSSVKMFIKEAGNYETVASNAARGRSNSNSHVQHMPLPPDVPLIKLNGSNALTASTTSSKDDDSRVYDHGLAPDSARVLKTPRTVHEELYEKFGLYEEDYCCNETYQQNVDNEMRANTADVEQERKTGFLYKMNQTGFRNWKKGLYTLTDTTLSWKSLDPLKRSHFNLKDCVIRRNEKKQNRFFISEIGMDAACDLLRDKRDASASVSTSSAGPSNSSIMSSKGLMSPLPRDWSSGGGGGNSIIMHTPGVGMNNSKDHKEAGGGGGGGGGSSGGKDEQHLFSPPTNRTLPGGIPAAGIVFQRELAAENTEQMEEWISAISDVISELNDAYTKADGGPSHNSMTEGQFFYFAHDWRQNKGDQGVQGGEPPGKKSGSSPSIKGDDNSNSSSSSSGILPKTTGFVSIGDWLRSLDLPQSYVTQYEQKFISKGYGNWSAVVKGGLLQQDLDFLGISNPLHCRLLLATVKTSYSSSIRVAVNGWIRFENSVLFKVVARWNFSRSSAFFRYSYFRKFDKEVRQAFEESCSEEEDAAWLGKLPNLPRSVPSRRTDIALSKANKPEIEFNNSQRNKLEIYMLKMAQVLTEADKLYLLLRFLDLNPFNPIIESEHETIDTNIDSVVNGKIYTDKS